MGVPLYFYMIVNFKNRFGTFLFSESIDKFPQVGQILVFKGDEYRVFDIDIMDSTVFVRSVSLNLPKFDRSHKVE